MAAKPWSSTYASEAKIGAALRVDGAGLEEGLALGLPARGGDRDGSESHDSDNSRFEELHF